MCGIAGYIGTKQAAPIILDGLSRLEYRGYDSAGIAVFDGEKIRMEKAAGRLRVLDSLTGRGASLPGLCGIGHTRWATHGCPSAINAHPHMNGHASIAVVHNGIIENYGKLKRELEQKGYRFVSDTDTEVVAHLLTEYYQGNPVEAIGKVMLRITGSFALGIMFLEHPSHVYAARRDSPLVAGFCGEDKFIASDVPAIITYTRNVYYPENEEIVCLSREHIRFYSIDGKPIKKEPSVIDWDIDAAQKGGYSHFMLKEIHEQPRVFKDTVLPRLTADDILLPELTLTEDEIRSLRKIAVVACGSALHAGAAGKYILEGLARIPVETDLSSEYRYRNPIYEQNSLVIIVSQSGETADSLAALRDARAHGAKVLAIVNVAGSSIAREADSVVYTPAGPEISVATTKAYSCQLAVFYLLALKFARVKKTIDGSLFHTLVSALGRLPGQMQNVLDSEAKLKLLSNRFVAAEHIFFMGRGLDYAISLEGSLKLKEISYIHSEAYAAGELKHGAISLIEEGSPVIAVATQDALYAKSVGNILEVKTRGAFVLALTTKKHRDMENVADFVIYVPETESPFSASLAVLPLQLLAFYTALGRRLDVDNPRNLAKSVTVE